MKACHLQPCKMAFKSPNGSQISSLFKFRVSKKSMMGLMMPGPPIRLKIIYQTLIFKQMIPLNSKGSLFPTKTPAFDKLISNMR